MILLCQSLIVVQIYLGNKKYISTWTAKPNCSLSHQFSYNDRYIKLLQDPNYDTQLQSTMKFTATLIAAVALFSTAFAAPTGT
jgi:hypothetical protein